VGGTQLYPSVAPTFLSSQPLPIGQTSLGQFCGDCGRLEWRDRFEVQALGVGVVGNKCPATGQLLAVTLGRTSHALAGATLFLVFSCGVVSQVATIKLKASRVLGLGTVSMLAGLVVLVVSVRLQTPNLALFLVSGALIGAGVGAVFKGTTGIVLEAAAPEDRLAMTSRLLVVLYVGLSIPVVGAGIALDQGATIPNTVLAFAILVGIGVTVSGLVLIRGGHQPPAHQDRPAPATPPTPEGTAAKPALGSTSSTFG
jgi:hypothetical protein